MSSVGADDAAELGRIAGEVRALLEWFDACGAEGIVASRPSASSEQGTTADPPARDRPAARDPAAAPSEPAAPRLPARQVPAEPAREARRPVRAPPSPSALPADAPVSAAAGAGRGPKLTAPEQALAEQEALARLAVLEQEVKRCTRCPLCESRTRTAFARGNARARLAFVGEGPGAEEDAQGLPFVGPAGQLLDRMIGAMGYQPEDVYICNVVKCRPPQNRKPEPAEMQACAPYLSEQLGLVEPEVIVALGGTAVQGLLEWYDAGPYGPPITRLRGNWKLYRGRIPLMPTFHPAYLLRTPARKRDVWSDLQAVMRRLEPPAPRAGPRG